MPTRTDQTRPQDAKPGGLRVARMLTACCEWCAAPASGARGHNVQLEHKRTGELRGMRLCDGCNSNPLRTVWRAWRRA